MSAASPSLSASPFSARRSQLYRESLPEVGEDERPLHAVDVVGVPQVDAELTAAADVLSRLDESPLCYFQWCVGCSATGWARGTSRARALPSSVALLTRCPPNSQVPCRS